jgi:tRNA U34 2-thiouridine synthase MnmA/TrmU
MTTSVRTLRSVNILGWVAQLHRPRVVCNKALEQERFLVTCSGACVAQCRRAEKANFHKVLGITNQILAQVRSHDSRFARLGTQRIG